VQVRASLAAFVYLAWNEERRCLVAKNAKDKSMPDARYPIDKRRSFKLLATRSSLAYLLRYESIELLDQDRLAATVTNPYA
jgi:hypothetical protein